MGLTAQATPARGQPGDQAWPRVRWCREGGAVPDAHDVVHLDPRGDPAVPPRVTDRAPRIGQRPPGARLRLVDEPSVEAHDADEPRALLEAVA